MTLPDSFVEKVFLHEIKSQADYCLAAAADVGPAITGESVDGVFRALHSVLTHSGNISKILWPAPSKDAIQSERMKKRAARLLARLTLDDSTLAAISNRALRNHLEHFDERLDSWASNNPSGLVDRIIGPVNLLGSFPAGSHLRHYDPGARSFRFADEQFDIADLVIAVARVRERAHAEHAA